MNIIFLIAGSIFLSIGTSITLGYYNFKKDSTKIKGRVKSIEKYLSTNISGAGNHRAKSTFFRPIVEYTYKNKTIIVAGIGSNEIRHRLGQRVNVLITLSNNDDIEARIEDGAYYIIGITLYLIGLVTIGAYMFSANNSAMLELIIVYSRH